MRRHQNEATNSVVLKIAEIKRGDRGAVAMAEEDAALEANGLDDGGKNVDSFARHIVERSRQFDRIGSAIAAATVGKDAEAGRFGQFLGEAPPKRHRPQTFVKKHDRRRLAGRRTETSTLEHRVAGSETKRR